MRKYHIFFFATLIFLSCLRDVRDSKEQDSNSVEVVAREMSFGSNTVKMTKKDGVYEIPIKINGVSMIFIFDTGAGLISISNTEAGFLYKQGKLTQEDIIGKANFMDANGDISVGTIIRLKTVQIGNKILYNVEASVVNNTNAPLLMGQSALEQFGKVSIDYNAQTITFD
jgi:aspartyl protease family protein